MRYRNGLERKVTPIEDWNISLIYYTRKITAKTIKTIEVSHI